MTKEELRKEIKTEKAKYTPMELYIMSTEVIGRLLDNAHFNAAECVLLYYSLPDEVDTHDLIETLWECGVKVCLPRVVAGGGLEVCLCQSAGELSAGAYGIMEPTGEALEDLSCIDVAIVPGFAFDAEGHRLGRGGGYYDRLLSTMEGIYKIGVGFDFQRRGTIPYEASDISVDAVV